MLRLEEIIGEIQEEGAESQKKRKVNYEKKVQVKKKPKQYQWDIYEEKPLYLLSDEIGPIRRLKPQISPTAERLDNLRKKGVYVKSRWGPDDPRIWKTITK